MSAQLPNAYPKTSLIIGAYKRADFLRLVLESVLRQTFNPLEVLVAEDGRDPEMLRVVKDYQSIFGPRLIHVSQEDIGNRKPLILNKAVLKSSGAYLVFIDGDCLLHKDFVSDHLELAESNTFLTGRRIELSQKTSTHLSAQKIQAGYLDGWPAKLMWDSIFGKTEHFGRFFKTPKFLRRMLKRDQINDIRGCNFSCHRKDFYDVNGYSNNFSGAYGEDSDLEYRLRFKGLKMKGCKGSAIQYHLWHKSQIHDQSNQSRLKELLESKNSWALNGLKEAESIL